MPLLVSDVLTDQVFRRARPEVLAGAEALSRPVRWVHSTDVDEAAALLQGGELLLTTALGLRGADEPRRRRFVRQLAEVGLAALAIELGWVFDEVPEDMVDEARRLELPLIALRHVVPFVETTEALNAVIVDDSIAVLRFSDEVSRAMTDVLLAGGDVAALVDVLGRQLGAPVLLDEPHGAVLGASPTLDVARAAVEGDEGTAVVRAAVVLAGVPFASLATPAADARRQRALSAALERAASVIALAVSREQSDAAHRVQAVRRLLEQVTRTPAGTRLGDDAVLASLSAAAGLPPHPRGWLAVLAAEGAPAAAVTLHQSVLDAGLVAAVAPVSGTVTAVVAVPKSAPEASADETLADVLAAALAREGPGGPAVFAVGPVRRTLGEVPSSVRQARASLQAAAVLAPGAAVVVAARHRADLLLLDLPRPRLAELADERLHELLALPPGRAADLLLTLETYLSHGRSATATARALNLQRQSLYQRIERIRALVGPDLDDPRAALDLALAVRARRLAMAQPTQGQ